MAVCFILSHALTGKSIGGKDSLLFLLDSVFVGLDSSIGNDLLLHGVTVACFLIAGSELLELVLDNLVSFSGVRISISSVPAPCCLSI